MQDDPFGDDDWELLRQPLPPQGGVPPSGSAYTSTSLAACLGESPFSHNVPSHVISPAHLNPPRNNLNCPARTGLMSSTFTLNFTRQYIHSFFTEILEGSVESMASFLHIPNGSCPRQNNSSGKIANPARQLRSLLSQGQHI